ncbi:hypothetical protein EJ110_NYTH58746 [Nymphaea thermarum]|nr:hypothetical protein EJ110_NYTH58746 [Nymphaea thermarum]
MKEGGTSLDLCHNGTGTAAVWIWFRPGSRSKRTGPYRRTGIPHISSTLSEEVLAGVDDDLSALDLWNVLATTYSQVSEARFLQLKRQFQDIKRGTRSVLKYIREIKNVSDQLAIIGHPVSDKDKVQQTLSGLGSDFDVFCTALECILDDQFQQLLQKLSLLVHVDRNMCGTLLIDGKL